MYVLALMEKTNYYKKLSDYSRYLDGKSVPHPAISIKHDAITNQIRAFV